MSIFEERVKELMIRRNVNQKELANKTGISEASLSRYLKGTSKPRMDVLVNIAKYFEVDVNTLTNNSDKKLSRNEAYVQTYSLVTRNKTKLSRKQKDEIIKILLGD